MKRHQQHAEKVDTWIENVVKDLSSEEKVQTFVAAIDALYARILVTLSEVTLSAIADRALHESQTKYPLLKKVQLEPGAISVNELIKDLDTKDSKQLTEAFRYFLVKLLTIVSNLTADIFTHALYEELNTISARTYSKIRKNREDV